MRPIDADTLKEGIACHKQYTDQKYKSDRMWGIGYNAGIDRALFSITYAHTIDAVPVIRCKACAWRSASGFCGRHGHPVGDDFFCANGTTEIVKKSKPAKKPEKKPEERCGLTDKPCTRCRPDACEHRRTV